MLVPYAAATTGKLVPATVLGITALRFAVTGVYQLTGSTGWKHAAGVVGLVLLAVALFAALALAVEDARGGTVLPVGRHGAGEDAVTVGLDAQLDGVEHAAGIRRQL
jgi:succinate-acetate transporter protein